MQQAYNLLVDHYEFSLPEMAEHMGEYGPGEGPWLTGSILVGAWREDTGDVIGNSGSYSGNHFWDADNGDDVKIIAQVEAAFELNAVNILHECDSNGNEVTTLIDKQQSEGRYEVNFDASSLASGVYIYRLSVNVPSTSSGQSFTSSKKMLLLK